MLDIRAEDISSCTTKIVRMLYCMAACALFLSLQWTYLTIGQAYSMDAII
jgi:hypothetical protein